MPARLCQNSVNSINLCRLHGLAGANSISAGFSPRPGKAYTVQPGPRQAGAARIHVPGAGGHTPGLRLVLFLLPWRVLGVAGTVNMLEMAVAAGQCQQSEQQQAASRRFERMYRHGFYP